MGRALFHYLKRPNVFPCQGKCPKDKRVNVREAHTIIVHCELCIMHYDQLFFLATNTSRSLVSFGGASV